MRCCLHSTPEGDAKCSRVIVVRLSSDPQSVNQQRWDDEWESRETSDDE